MPKTKKGAKIWTMHKLNVCTLLQNQSMQNHYIMIPECLSLIQKWTYLLQKGDTIMEFQ